MSKRVGAWNFADCAPVELLRVCLDGMSLGLAVIFLGALS